MIGSSMNSQLKIVKKIVSLPYVLMLKFTLMILLILIILNKLFI